MGAKGITEQRLIWGKQTREEPGLTAKGERYRIISIFDLFKFSSGIAFYFKME